MRLVRHEKSLAGTIGHPATDQAVPVKNKGGKPTYAQLARLWPLVGEDHAHVQDFLQKLDEYEAGRPAEEILQAKSELIQSLEERLAKAGERKASLEEAAAKAKKAIED